MIAAITFSGAGWAWAAWIAAVVLVPLGWFAWRPAAPQRGAVAIGMALRTAGIGLLLLCLVDPQWTAPRPKRGANIVAILADNSAGLGIADGGAGRTRGDALRALLTPEPAWEERVAQEFQVRRYTFGESLRRVRDFSGLAFDGSRTSLGAALAELRERFSGQPLAGVLLLTDGNATDEPGGFADLRGLPPIYPVVFGRGDGLRDVGIARADPRQTAFDDAPVSLRVELDGVGVTAEPFQVNVRQWPVASATAEANSAAPPAQVVEMARKGETTQVNFEWRPAGTGVQFYEVTVEPRADSSEATVLNNRRLVMFDRGRPGYRILYVGGRPNWEFKFLNRALITDPQLQLVGLLRLALREPKFEFRGRAGEASNPLFRGFGGAADEAPRYDQPVLTRLNTRDADELRGGFPHTAEDLFHYDAVVLDDVEAGFFAPEQLELLRRFVADRGGGLLMLGGVDTLEAGGYRDTPLASALPVYLDRVAPKPPTGPLALTLTREGWLEPWTRVRAQEAAERERLERMPRFLVANSLSAVKPGATILAEVADETGEPYPALVAQPYGAGRVACLGLGDLWRWGMAGAEQQADLARFWRQIARWLVTDVPSQVELRVVTSESRVELLVNVKDREYRPLELAQPRLTIRRLAGADGTSTAADENKFEQATMSAEPSPEVPGRYVAAFSPREPGAYLATVEVADRAGQMIDRAEAGWVHDPAADEFRSLVPNRALMEELARRTGGVVLDPAELDGFADRLVRGAAPVMETFSRPLWHNAWYFAVVLGCFLAEWGWRRWKGLP